MYGAYKVSEGCMEHLRSVKGGGGDGAKRAVSWVYGAYMDSVYGVCGAYKISEGVLRGTQCH